MTAQTPPTIPEALRKRIDAIAGAYLRDASAVGLAVGVHYRGAEAALGYGLTRREGGAPPDGDTFFEIGSITKVFTTLLLADMARRGEVGLEDPVRLHLPPDVRVPARGGREITLLHLATHTSGLPRLPGNLDGPRSDPQNPYAHYTEEELFAFLSGHRLRRLPGRVKAYSNLGSGLLGTALARAAGKSYEELVRERICLPLGMAETGMHLGEAARARLAPGHADGSVVPNWDLGLLAGAGGLRSSIGEMLRFLAAQLGQAGEGLRESVALSHRQQFGRRFFISGGYYLMRSAAGLGLLWAASSALWPGLPWLARILLVAPAWWVGDSLLGGWLDARCEPIALGWHLRQESGASEPVLWHNGGTGGYCSYLAFSPEKRVGVVVLANSTRDADATGAAILAALLGAPSGADSGS